MNRPTHPPAVAALRHRICRHSFVFALLAAILFPLGLFAQEATTTGTIEGRVFNAASGAYLNNARVTVEGTTIQTFTDDSGTYRLRLVPTGLVKLKVTYSGQADLTDTVDVVADKTANADFTFNAGDSAASGKTIVLDKFVVEAPASATRRRSPSTKNASPRTSIRRRARFPRSHDRR